MNHYGRLWAKERGGKEKRLRALRACAAGSLEEALGGQEVTWKAAVYDRAIHSICDLCDPMRMRRSEDSSTIGAGSK